MQSEKYNKGSLIASTIFSSLNLIASIYTIFLCVSIYQAGHGENFEGIANIFLIPITLILILIVIILTLISVILNAINLKKNGRNVFSIVLIVLNIVLISVGIIGFIVAISMI